MGTLSSSAPWCLDLRFDCTYRFYLWTPIYDRKMELSLSYFSLLPYLLSKVDT